MHLSPRRTVHFQVTGPEKVSEHDPGDPGYPDSLFPCSVHRVRARVCVPCGLCLFGAQLVYVRSIRQSQNRGWSITSCHHGKSNKTGHENSSYPRDWPGRDPTWPGPCPAGRPHFAPGAPRGPRSCSPSARPPWGSLTV